MNFEHKANNSSFQLLPDRLLSLNLRIQVLSPTHYLKQMIMAQTEIQPDANFSPLTEDEMRPKKGFFK